MDVVGDFLTRIRNAGLASHEKVDIPSSKLREGIARILKERGFIRSYKTVKDKKQGIMRVYLKYSMKGEHVISALKRMSRPGCRRFVSMKDVPEVRSGMGVAILSTNKGVVSEKEARDLGVGGEYLCCIW